MQAWFESLPTWVVALFSITALGTLFYWGARDRVRSGMTKTIWGGVAMEVLGLVLVISFVTLVMTTYASFERAIPNLRAIQYVAAGILSGGISILCYRSFILSERTATKAMWVGRVLGILSGYLLCRGWLY